MKVRSLVTAIIVILAFAVCAIAQGNGGPGGPGARQEQEAIFKDLGLSDTQTQKVKDIAAKYRTDVMEIYRSQTVPQADKQTRVEEIKKKAVEDINAVLTPEQLEKAKAADFANKILSRPPQFGARNGRGGLRGIVAQLNLTDTQKPEVEKIIKAQEEAMQALRNDTTSTMGSEREKMQQIQKDTLDKIKALLTDEQKTKLEELMKQMPGPGMRGGNGAPGGNGGRRGNRGNRGGNSGGSTGGSTDSGATPPPPPPAQ